MGGFLKALTALFTVGALPFSGTETAGMTQLEQAAHLRA